MDGDYAIAKDAEQVVKDFPKVKILQILDLIRDKEFNLMSETQHTQKKLFFP